MEATIGCIILVLAGVSSQNTIGLNDTFGKPCQSFQNCDSNHGQYCDLQHSVCRCLPGYAHDRVAQECRRTRCSANDNQSSGFSCPPGSECIDNLCTSYCSLIKEQSFCFIRPPASHVRYDHFYQTVYFCVMAFLALFFGIVLLFWLRIICTRMRCKRVLSRDGKPVLAVDIGRDPLKDGRSQPTKEYSLCYCFPQNTTA